MKQSLRWRFVWPSRWRHSGNIDRNVKINLTAPGSANTEMYPGKLPPTACHPTVEWLLDLDEAGPTGPYFRLGKELQMVPGFTHCDPDAGEVDAEHSTPLEQVVGDRIRGRDA